MTLGCPENGRRPTVLVAQAPRNGVPAGATEILRPAKVEKINGRNIYVLYIHNIYNINIYKYYICLHIYLEHPLPTIFRVAGIKISFFKKQCFHFIAIISD